MDTVLIKLVDFLGDGFGGSGDTGFSVCVSDDALRVAVGAVHDLDLGSTSGAAYVYARNGAHDAEGAWALDAVLYGADQISGDEAGYSVAMSADGSRVAVGTPGHEFAGTPANAGAVRVFDFDAGAWSETATLTAEVGGSFTNHYLGRSVAVSASGSTVAGGAPGGSLAYSWQMEEEQELSRGTCPADRLLVVPVASAGECSALANFASVPAPDDACVASGLGVSQSGGLNASAALPLGENVLTFESSDSTSACATTVRVVKALEVGPKGDTGSDEYGRVVRVSRDGQIVAVGTMYDDDVGTNTGSVSMMIRNGTNEWVEHQQLYAQPAVGSTYFAHRMDMSADGQLVAVGSLYFDDQGTNTGKAFLYRWSDVTSRWEFEASLLPRSPATSGHFGGAVATDEHGDHLAVGEYNHGEGKVHFYSRAGGVWTVQATLGPAQSGVGTQHFGHTLAMDLSGSTVVVGAYATDTGLTDRGAAFVFTRTGSDWQQQVRLFAPDSQASDLFGLAVDVSGNGRWLAVGSRQDDDRGADTGSVYLYERGGENSWIFRRKVYGHNVQSSDHFGGEAVALDDLGERLIVTARYDDTDGSNRGAAYVFERDGSNEWHQLGKLTPHDADPLIGGSEFG